MIIDCFTFFNELDMLECRLEYLNEKVDYFVLVEATVTHSGKPKPLYFAENKNRYEKFLDKIIHIPLDIPVADLDWNHAVEKNFNNASWQVENQQRNGILEGIKRFPNDAAIMIRDLDEIPNKDAIDRAIRMLKFKPFVSLETRQFYYNLKQCLVELWPATVIGLNQQVQHVTPQTLRDGRQSLTPIKQGGWHLTYFGNAELIQNKILNFAHQEFNTEKYTNIEYIKQKIQTGQELYERPFPMVNVALSEFPEDFKKCFSRYQSNQLVHYAETVDGFFDLQDFEFYKKVVAQASSGQHFVEVGSYKGRSSAFMAVEIALSGKSIQFDCVDTWEGSEEHQSGELFEDADVVSGQLYNVFLKNMKPVSGYFNPVRLTSLNAAAQYTDNSIDMVFIDAAHDYENVLADIKVWAPKVKSGGIISGHDWHHLPIKQAVLETLGEVNNIGNCWYVFKA